MNLSISLTWNHENGFNDKDDSPGDEADGSGHDEAQRLSHGNRHEIDGQP